MLDGNHSRHAVPYISSRKIGILFLQYAKLSGISIDHIGEHGLKAGQMSAAFGIINIIAEAKHILMKFIDILKCRFHGDTLALSAEINHVMDGFLGFIHILDKSCDTLRFMICDNLRLFPTSVLETNRQFRIQIGSLMKTAFYIILFEAGLIKNGIVRQEINCGSCLFCLTLHRKQTVFQGYDRNSSLIFIFIDKAACFDRNSHSGRKGIHHRRTHAMKTAAGLVSGIVKFASCVKRCEYQPFRADTLLMHSHRNPSAIVNDRSGAVSLQNYLYGIADSRQMFVHSIIYNFID